MSVAKEVFTGSLFQNILGEVPRALVPEVLWTNERKDTKTVCVRWLQNGAFTSDRWLGAWTRTLFAGDLGAELCSGSFFMPVGSWGLDVAFEMLIEEVQDLRNGPVSIEFAHGTPCLAIAGLGRLGSYALSEVYDSLDSFAAGEPPSREAFCGAVLVSRHPFPLHAIAGPISFECPEKHFIPATKPSGGMVRTEKTLLGVATAKTETLARGSQGLCSKFWMSAKKLAIPEIQFRSDISKALPKSLELFIVKNAVHPSLPFHV